MAELTKKQQAEIFVQRATAAPKLALNNEQAARRLDAIAEKVAEAGVGDEARECINDLQENDRPLPEFLNMVAAHEAALRHEARLKTEEVREPDDVTGHDDDTVVEDHEDKGPSEGEGRGFGDSRGGGG